MQQIFAVSYNTETKEAAVTGNIELTEALRLLQDIYINMEVQKSLTAQKEGAKLDNAKDGKSEQGG